MARLRAALAASVQDHALRARALLQSVLDTMQDAVLLLDADGVCRFANRAFLAMHRLPPTLISGDATFDDLMRFRAERGEFGPPDQAEAQMAVGLARFHAARGYSHTRQLPGGQWVEFYYFRMPEGGTLVVYRDVTVLKQQEAHLARERDAAEAANQAKSAFLAVMSHEIRTPLNGVVGLLDLLESTDATAGQRPILAAMRESAGALLGVVDDVLDFSRIEAGRLELEEAPFSLAALIEGAAGAFRPRAAANGVVLEAAVSGPDRLLGDAGRIRQVLFNLLGNAVKFTPYGRISVQALSIPAPGGRVRVRISVADSGIGIPAAVLPRLFTPFVQADTSTPRRFGGSGLGLSIVRRLAERMEGGVVVESQPGQGTVFDVDLLLRPGWPQSAAAAALPPAIAAIGRVLVVDDHPINREVLQRQLASIGLAAEISEDGESGWQRFRSGGFAVVLIDLHMPQLDGFALARRIRAEERRGGGSRTWIAAVTADAMPDTAERCRSAGFDAILHKPLTIARLRQTLDAWLAPGPRPAVDRAALAAWLGDDRSATEALLGQFLASATETEAALATALRCDPAAVPALAHRLRGAALAVGAGRLAELAAEIEGADDLADGPALLAALGAELRRVTREIAPPG